MSVWVQLRIQLEYVIATGELLPGVKLPAVRVLAQRLGVAVDRALLGLLADGVTPAIAGQAVQQRLAMLRLGLRVSFVGVR
ncbi:hypothetical protein [Nonomuraea jabiensis]|uniref:hypothetical protein n=1 Tax=Nonomuraea jabiensis TaxID=882448 RepID=UPI003D750BAC